MNSLHYLNRIGFAGTINTDLHTLCRLHEHHVFSIPFEDLDIQAGVPIHLSRNAFYEKLVTRKRGGYCYEVNGLFHQLLLHLGFKADLVSARIRRGRNFGSEYDHLAIVVHLAGKTYLVDVGYGDFSLKPLVIEPGLRQSDGRNFYLIDEVLIEDRNYYSVAKWNTGRHNYVIEYYFTTIARTLEEFRERNNWQQSSPDSHFTQNLICSLPTHDGRISIVNNRLITTVGTTKKETHIADGQLPVLLKRYFGISLAGEDIKRDMLHHASVSR